MFGRSLRMAFWIYYDHLGTFVALNLLVALVMAAPVWMAGAALLSGDPALWVTVGLPLYFLVTGILWPLGLVGVLAYARQRIDERSGSFGDFFAGVRRHGVQAVLVGSAYAVAVAGLLFGMWFYAVRVGASAPWAGIVLSGVAGWALVLLLPTAPWALTAVVFRRCGAGMALRLGAGLAFGHPGLSLALSLGTGVLLLLALSPPGFLLLTVAPVAVWWAAAYEILARQYAVAGGQPLAWNDANDDYLNRGWSDLLFPWKS